MELFMCTSETLSLYENISREKLKIKHLQQYHVVIYSYFAFVIESLALFGSVEML